MLTLEIGRRSRVAVDSLEEASRVYQEVRDNSGEGGSTFPEGRVVDSGVFKARISYNGRVWAEDRYVAGATPIMEAVR